MLFVIVKVIDFPRGMELPWVMPKRVILSGVEVAFMTVIVTTAFPLPIES